MSTMSISPMRIWSHIKQTESRSTSELGGFFSSTHAAADVRHCHALAAPVRVLSATAASNQAYAPFSQDSSIWRLVQKKNCCACL